MQQIQNEYSSMDFKLIRHDNQNAKSNRAVMLFHGMTGSPFELRKYAKFLYEQGLDVYCYCLPGHGDHPIDIYSVTFEDWMNFVDSRYENLRSCYDEFFVGGLCLGAVLALHIAQKYKDVTGIISLSTTLFLDGWTIPWYNFLMPLGLYTILRYYYTFPEREPYGIKNEKVRHTISKLMSKNTVALDHYPLSSVFELLKLSRVVRKNMNKVQAPVLIVHSKQDDLTSIKSAKFVCKYVSSAIKEYIELDDSYHLVLYDNQKDLVYKKSIAFIDSLSFSKIVNEEKGALKV